MSAHPGPLSVTGPDAPFLDVRVGGRVWRRLDLDDPRVTARILEEMAAGVDVYYDRAWPPTRRFVELLLDRPALVAGRDALIVGAGVGLEAVVVGRLADAVRLNDLAPVALELAELQLRANGLDARSLHGGSFAEVPLDPPPDVVVACYVVYDDATRTAFERLLERTRAAEVPVLLAGEDIGGHLSRVIASARRPVASLLEEGATTVVRIGG